MTARLLACFALLLTTGCTSKEGDGSKPAAKVSISSVQMISDCPHKDEASEAAAGAAMQPPADMARGDSLVPFEQPCTQSAMQLAIESEVAAPFSIEAVRVLSSAGAQLATVQSRKPAAWVDEGYQPWNERLEAHKPVKASYKLSVPDWYEVDKKLGGGESSVGKMFLLEVDVLVDGKRLTIRSSAFPREEDHVVVT